MNIKLLCKESTEFQFITRHYVHLTWQNELKDKKVFLHDKTRSLTGNYYLYNVL